MAQIEKCRKPSAFFALMLCAAKKLWGYSFGYLAAMCWVVNMSFPATGETLVHLALLSNKLMS